MKVLVFTKYPRMGASSRLRTLQYLPLLEQHGFEFTVRSLFDEAYLENLYNNSSRSRLAVLKYYCKRLITLFSVYRYDLIWIEYELFPYLPAFAERYLRLIGKEYIVDYDDAIFHNYDLFDNSIIRKFLAKKIDMVMAKSSCVIAGNAYLAERARAAGGKYIEWVPTVVDQSRYVPMLKEKGNQKVIGWIGSPSTQKYILDIKEALHTVCELHSARLLLVGATQDIVDEFSGIEVEVAAWSEDSEAQLIQQMDIGVMPLPDGPWEKGKCGYKLIQYMACGIPVVASPVGVNNDIISDGKCGYLADNLEQWADSLSILLSSQEKRQMLGDAGRKAVEKTYSLQVQAPILARIFNSIIKSDVT
ncbi:probable glycosyl transferase, group 1 [Psychrobacter arcticus 273-4]|uniref:Probable glycosyl transferase, group 1 n=1 Tax=Psychrobacter arcticus (strain DSM 17307 / VKM B-2377 / 273-4) TaxID=259536 RepID=Q4FTY2_PSYA2|nr:glycosyltransferase family 4 protein [Psychrobacter arcticus]AAZ18526.1 probable glycosyl transferase, group 1 [Psychrobacter arcticus 273-4]